MKENTTLLLLALAIAGLALWYFFIRKQAPAKSNGIIMPTTPAQPVTVKNTMATVRVSNAGKPLKPKQALPVKTIKTATASDQATAYAKEIRKAVNPSGRPVDINSDGTKEIEIQNIGSRMRKTNTTYAQVASAYSRLYSELLTRRLQKELSVKDLNAFFLITNTIK